MGVIAKALTETFLPETILFDSSTVKEYGGRRAVYNVDPAWRPNVAATYYSHQYWIWACFFRYQRFLALADTGLGKTKVGLDAIQYAFDHWNVKHALVLTGYPISTSEWTGQAEKYITIPASDIAGTAAQRRAQLVHFPQTPILVSDYSTLQTTFAVKQTVRRKNKLVPDLEALYNFGRQFDVVILDEIHRLKNRQSLRFSMVEAIVADIPIRWGLTGTLFDRRPEEAWAQFYLIDGGETFGTYNQFLAYFFDEKPSRWSKWSFDYRLKKQKREEFKTRVRHRSIRIATKECKDIPIMRVVEEKLPPTIEQREYIKAIEQQVRAAREHGERLNSFSYLRQIVSGLRRVHNDEIDATLRLSVSPKIEWLLAFLESLPDDEQVVIFYEFRASGEWLNETLTTNKYKVSWLYGGMGPEKEMLAYLAWKTKKTRLLVTQTEKAGESLNLQQSAYIVQYEAPLTYRKEKQSLARVASRIGGRPAVVYKLSIRGCIEQRVLQLIYEGKEISEDLLEES